MIMGHNNDVVVVLLLYPSTTRSIISRIIDSGYSHGLNATLRKRKPINGNDPIFCLMSLLMSSKLAVNVAHGGIFTDSQSFTTIIVVYYWYSQHFCSIYIFLTVAINNDNNPPAPTPAPTPTPSCK